MIRSMTGFGRGSASSGAWAVEARLKTLNHRYLELQLRGLEGQEELELQLRRLLEGSFTRGRIELLIELEYVGEGAAFDLEAARRYQRSLKALVEELGLEGGVGLSELIALGALKPAEAEGLWPLLERAVREAIAQVQESRLREGERLREELELYLGRVEELVEAIAARAPQVKLYYKERLRERAKELLVELEEERLEEEAVLFAERSDISEELARLRSHLAGARAALSGPEPAGRVLDFLAQEMFREANTISAKAHDLEVLNRAVAMRLEIERLREQVRNIE
ncbi:MAG: YicC/YloC family endoribonuclease [Candidatus Bipolaricaulia bacterium]